VKVPGVGKEGRELGETGVGGNMKLDSLRNVRLPSVGRLGRVGIPEHGALTPTESGEANCWRWVFDCKTILLIYSPYTGTCESDQILEPAWTTRQTAQVSLGLSK
jgi:hypothetical protein